jgi:hypothetical protein
MISVLCVGYYLKASSASLGGTIEIRNAALRELECMLAGITTSVFAGYIMSQVNPMAFYSNFYVASLVYIPPTLLGVAAARTRHNRLQRFSPEMARNLAFGGSLAVLAVILAVLTAVGLLSAYVFLLTLLGPLLGRVWGKGNVVVHCLACLIPTIYWMQVCVFVCARAVCGLCVSLYLSMYTCMYICKYIYIYMYMYMYVCMYVCMYIYMYICIYIYIHVKRHVSLHTNDQTSIPMHACLYIHTAV